MVHEHRPPPTNRPCVACGRRDEHGEVGLQRETVTGEGEWERSKERDVYPLCGPDWDWVVDLARRVSSGAAESRLGVPSRETTAATGLPACDHCQARLGEQAVALEIAPSRRAIAIGARRGLDTWNYRLCGQCAAWWRATLYDSSAVRMQSTRQREGASGGWLSSTAMDVVAIGLGSRDSSTLRTVVEAEGQRYYRLRTNELSRLVQWTGAAIFVGASGAGRAGRVVAALPSALCAQTVVVGRGDAIDDVRQALLAGAADMLAWPLSPQQIAGAIDRLKDPPQVGGGDESTGLAVLRQGFPIHGGPGHLLRIAPPGDTGPMEAALLLRRFLRGYDVVGCDGAGALAAVVACEAAHLEAVGNRVRAILGEATAVDVVDTAEGAAA